MRAYLRKRLEALGITSTRYIVDYEGVVYDYNEMSVIPKIWGMTLEHDRHGKLYIESQANDYGTNMAFYVRTRQGDPATTIGTAHRRQQDAVAKALHHWAYPHSVL